MHRRVRMAAMGLLLTTSLCVAAPSITKWLTKTQTTILSTELNALASNAYSVASAAINNTVGGGGNDGYILCDVEFVGTFAANPTAGGSVLVWFLLAPDGTNYETTPTATVSLNRAPNVELPVVTGQTGTRVAQQTVCPPNLFRVAVKMNATGQALTATGHLLRMRAITPEGV